MESANLKGNILNDSKDTVFWKRKNYRENKRSVATQDALEGRRGRVNKYNMEQWQHCCYNGEYANEFIKVKISGSYFFTHPFIRLFFSFTK